MKNFSHREISFKLWNSCFLTLAPFSWEKLCVIVVEKSTKVIAAPDRNHQNTFKHCQLELLIRKCHYKDFVQFFLAFLQQQKIIINVCSFHLAQLSLVFFSIFLPFLMRLKLSHNVGLLVLLNLIISIPFISFLLWSIKLVG